MNFNIYLSFKELTLKYHKIKCLLNYSHYIDMYVNVTNGN